MKIITLTAALFASAAALVSLRIASRPAVPRRVDLVLQRTITRRPEDSWAFASLTVADAEPAPSPAQFSAWRAVYTGDAIVRAIHRAARSGRLSADRVTAELWRMSLDSYTAA